MQQPSQGSAPTRPRNADATRELLLATAAGVFTELGFDGARVDEIARRAGVNKRMIYVYFGDKEGFYHEVLRTAVEQIARATEISFPPDASPRECLEAWIARYFGFLAEHPDLVRLVEWEALADGSRSAAMVQSVAIHEIKWLTEQLRRGQEAGLFRADVDPTRVLMTIHALCFGTLARRRLWNTLWQLDLSVPAAVASVTRSLTDVVLNGIRADNPPETPTPTKEYAR